MIFLIKIFVLLQVSVGKGTRKKKGFDGLNGGNLFIQAGWYDYDIKTAYICNGDIVNEDQDIIREKVINLNATINDHFLSEKE